MRLGLLGGLILTCALLVAGCGSGGDDTSGATTASGGAAKAPAGAEGEELPGVRGEHIGTEAAGTLHVSGSDCQALRKLAEGQVGDKLEENGEPTPPSSRCRLTAHGVRIGVYLDNGRSAARRYNNRMVEQDQFGAPDPGKITYGVPNVGDPAPGNQNASWVPDLATLFAARGNRWLTVAYSVEGLGNRRSRDQAAALARAGFRLTSK
jgi:hypothetical protein